MGSDAVIHSRFTPHVRSWRVGGVLAAVAFVLLLPPAASANGLRENTSWQFETAGERAQKASILEVILRKNAGAYKPGVTNITNYNIAGDYIDCNMTSQAIGNQGNNSQDAPMGSPTIAVGSDTSSSASGNASTGTISAAGGSSHIGLTSDSYDPVNNDATAGGVNSVYTDQSNNGSTQNSSAYNNTFDAAVSGISGSGGGSVALNSTQSMANSTVSASISNSTACDFNVVSDSIGSPINRGVAK